MTLVIMRRWCFGSTRTTSARHWRVWRLAPGSRSNIRTMKRERQATDEDDPVKHGVGGIFASAPSPSRFSYGTARVCKRTFENSYDAMYECICGGRICPIRGSIGTAPDDQACIRRQTDRRRNRRANARVTDYQSPERQAFHPH